MVKITPEKSAYIEMHLLLKFPLGEVMGRRRKVVTDAIGFFWLIVFVLAIGIIKSIYSWLTSPSVSGSLPWVIGCLAVAAVLYFFLKEMFRQRAEEKLNDEIDRRRENQDEIFKKILYVHLKELATRKQQLVFSEGYGLTNTKKWDAEKRKFLRTVFLPEIEGEPVASQDYFLQMIELMVSNFIETNRGTDTPIIEALSPVDYERHCADVLKRFGWSAKVTVSTGDQGADVIAEKDQTTVVLQCKKYSSPVGNKAVQEVFAAKGFYNSDKAVVVSNSTYTQSARQLAKKLDVYLVHHHDLEDLERLLME